ncbi:sensor histidine kinase NtrY-like [Bombella pollinis]|uniref:histidine kinase n=1 Tax=Bombella pollinis TaxID=2967337 RepID=A0ABT3WPB9_9PROT|nr:ATP-binding protein [Bombella pollinis]MCX5620059.1 ATP-binding protein [Bombella pollinis]
MRRFFSGKMRASLWRLTSPNGMVVLTVVALVLTFVTFIVLAGGVSLARVPRAQALLFLLDFITIMLIGAAAVRQIGRMLAERRMGQAGARLHTQLVMLFGVVAVAPALMVGVLSALFFHYGVEIWFSNRVNNALSEARSVAAGYLREHNENTRTEAFALANTLLTVQNDEMFTHGTDLFHDHSRLQALLEDEVTERGLNDAIIFNPLTYKIIATGGLLAIRAEDPQKELPPRSVAAMARTGEVVLLDQPEAKLVRGVVSLGGNSGLMLVITRPVDPEILHHMTRTNALVQDYQRMLNNRGKAQLVLIVILALMGLLVLAVGMLSGLSQANRITRPLSQLIRAAQRISRGDLTARVPVEGKGNREDELMALSRAFNLMASQLADQRSELMLAYDQIDERRRFTETVLAGVSAGVIGLDHNQLVELPNRAASFILQRDMEQAKGRPLVAFVPEFAALLQAVKEQPDKEHGAEIQIDAEHAHAPGGPGSGGGAGAGRTLLVCAVADQNDHAGSTGYVVTFDDITLLQVAQRKAAWADVARRIAHEIKNPLTPIQLAAERLRRRFHKEITSDPEIYDRLISTIVRQVGDIGRMVDEFSSFARMPQPEMAEHDLVRLCRETLFLQQNAHPEIAYQLDMPEGGAVIVRCDHRLISQSLINLLQNAADAILMTKRQVGEGHPVIGTIILRLTQEEGAAIISVADNGVGLPAGEHQRLTEPYVTHKEKGTGLGLAIVHRAMEAHHGQVRLRPLTEQECQMFVGPLEAGQEATGTLVALHIPLMDKDLAGDGESRA